MKDFGSIIRDLRVAQDLGLREAAGLIGISPAYLSRVERGKERPPRPNVIKELARVLAADPDVLFRLSSSTDPELTDYLHEVPEAVDLLRFVKDAHLSPEQISQLIDFAQQVQSHQSSNTGQT
jgi:transcriptional regulator with XRE-family HTH domain